MALKKNPTIGVVIPTYCAERHIIRCLCPLLQSSIQPRLLVIDSSSPDRTAEMAREMGVEVISIPQQQFNHGTTREQGRKHLDTDIVVMMTQDAYAYPDTLERLVKPIIDGIAAISYGRQLPHDNATSLEAFARNFNYPAESHLRSIKDAPHYGNYTFFCSDSCAAYDNRALDEIGGFASTLLGEDTVAAAKLLRRGHTIAYVAEARVHHSHHYTLLQEFRRHYDTGLMRREYWDLLSTGEKDEKRGLAYTKTLLQTIAKKNIFLIPYTVAHIGAKWIGHRLGHASLSAPSWFKRLCSAYPNYWIHHNP